MSVIVVAVLFIVVAIAGFIILFAKQIRLLYATDASSRFFSGPDASVYMATLAANWSIRILIYLVVPARSWNGKGYASYSAFIIIDVATILFISLLHSRQIKLHTGNIQVSVSYLVACSV
jgi:hypothetical protein